MAWKGERIDEQTEKSADLIRRGAGKGLQPGLSGALPAPKLHQCAAGRVAVSQREVYEGAHQDEND